MAQTRADIANVVERTLAIRTPSQTGTALAFDHGPHQYLVTAAHLVRNLVNGNVVDERSAKCGARVCDAKGWLNQRLGVSWADDSLSFAMSQGPRR